MASHTATGEWQSFEVRMRRRRAERLVVRAEVALDAGFAEEARAALAEAKRLDASLTGIADVEARIAAASAKQADTSGRRRTLAIGVSVAAVAAAVVLLSVVGRNAWHRAASVTSATKPSALSASATPSSPVSVGDPSVIVQTHELPPVVTKRGIAEKPSTPEPVATSGETSGSSPLPSDAAVHDTEAALRTTTPPPLSLPAPSAVAAPSEPAAVAPPPVASPRADAEPAATAAVNAPSDEDLVRRVLRRYADAYTRLDAGAAQAVWPSVNRDALARAFGDLAAQSIALGDCAIDVRAAVAHASCAGSATWQPRIGGSSPRTDPRRWSFDLSKGSSGWVIRNARVQNR